MVSIKDLLQYDGELEDGEDFIESNTCQVSPGSRGIMFKNLIAREPSCSTRNRCQRITLRSRHYVDPVSQKDTEINQWIPNSTHFPIKYRNDSSQIVCIKHDVVEFVVTVQQRWLTGIC